MHLLKYSSSSLVSTLVKVTSFKSYQRPTNNQDSLNRSIGNSALFSCLRNSNFSYIENASSVDCNIYTYNADTDNKTCP